MGFWKWCFMANFSKLDGRKQNGWRTGTGFTCSALSSSVSASNFSLLLSMYIAEVIFRPERYTKTQPSFVRHVSNYSNSRTACTGKNICKGLLQIDSVVMYLCLKINYSTVMKVTFWFLPANWFCSSALLMIGFFFSFSTNLWKESWIRSHFWSWWVTFATNWKYSPWTWWKWPSDYCQQMDSGQVRSSW